MQYLQSARHPLTNARALAARSNGAAADRSWWLQSNAIDAAFDSGLAMFAFIMSAFIMSASKTTCGETAGRLHCNSLEHVVTCELKRGGRESNPQPPA
jgi:hypothetical protein